MNPTSILDAFGGVRRILQIMLGAGITTVGVVFIIASTGVTKGLVGAVMDVTPVGKIGTAADAVTSVAKNVAK